MTDQTQRTLDEFYQFTDFAWALEQGFTPTSKYIPPSTNWGGKYRCIFCTVTGYVNYGWRNNPVWWGHRHGNDCRKRVDRTV